MISDAVILERALSFAKVEMHTIGLQCRRLRTKEPEDEEFRLRWWADLQFLIVALTRLRRSVELAQKVTSAKKNLSSALKIFDKTLPDLITMRNVGEHFDVYVRGKGKNKTVSPKSLQTGTFDRTTYKWLDKSINIDAAHKAAEELYSALLNLKKSLCQR
ncbi:MAG: hypothetical protein ACE5E9_09420 [Nitrospinaceae bacterium]